MAAEEGPVDVPVRPVEQELKRVWLFRRPVCGAAPPLLTTLLAEDITPPCLRRGTPGLARVRSRWQLEPASSVHQTPFCALDFALGSHPSCSRSTSEVHTDLIASPPALLLPLSGPTTRRLDHTVASGLVSAFILAPLCLSSPVPHPSLPDLFSKCLAQVDLFALRKPSSFWVASFPFLFIKKMLALPWAHQTVVSRPGIEHPPPALEGGVLTAWDHGVLEWFCLKQGKI